ncbi:MAG: sulfotransferase family protein, partial [Thermodesulfobacteriota bacterium]
MDSNIDQKLAFIVGHYKSGSTWLINMLSLHPDICGTGEAHVFRYAWSGKDFHQVTEELYKLASWGGIGSLFRHRAADWTRHFRGLWRQVLPPEKRPKTRYDLSIYKQYQLYNKLKNCKTSEEYCILFFSYLLQAWKPRSYLVEKTPNNIYYLSNIYNTFPKAKLIAIYRDGRDFVVSHKHFIEKFHNEKWELHKSAKIWKNAIDAQLESQDKYNIFTLSYESLQNDGAKKIKELLNYLELSSDKQIISEMLEKSSFKKITKRDPGYEEAGSFFRKGVVGDWKNHFSEDNKREFKQIAGDLLIKLNYEK